MIEEKISIVVPIYNQEKYLDKSISSILNQTYSNIEIVAVNDGSTDRSTHILREFAEKYNRLKIVNKENGGLIDAVAEGIRHSDGNFIAFMDPDDYVGENYLQALYELMSDDIDIVSAGMYSYEIGESDTIGREVYLDADTDYNCIDIKDSFFWNKAKACNVNLIFQSRCSKLYRKKILDGIVDEYQSHKEAVIGEDTLFNFLALCKSNTIRTRRNPVEYYYCLRQGASMTRDTDFEKSYLKCRNTLVAFRDIVNRYSNNSEQIFSLYYLQIQGIMYQASYYCAEYRKMQKIIRGDKDYALAYKTIIGNSQSMAKIGMIRKMINELYLPVALALGARKLRNILGKIRKKIGDFIH